MKKLDLSILAISMLFVVSLFGEPGNFEILNYEGKSEADGSLCKVQLRVDQEKNVHGISGKGAGKMFGTNESVDFDYFTIEEFEDFDFSAKKGFLNDDLILHSEKSIFIKKPIKGVVNIILDGYFSEIKGAEFKESLKVAGIPVSSSKLACRELIKR